MRKHNKKLARRWARESGDRSNFPQTMAHSFVNSKFSQYISNFTLQALLERAGVFNH